MEDQAKSFQLTLMNEYEITVGLSLALLAQALHESSLENAQQPIP